MQAPTDKQINAEIKKLTDVKPRVPHYTMFGDDNWEKLEAQVKVMEERMEEDAVLAYFEDKEHPDNTADMVSNVLEAVRWLEGETKTAPSEGWVELADSVKKRK